MWLRGLSGHGATVCLPSLHSAAGEPGEPGGAWGAALPAISQAAWFHGGDPSSLFLELIQTDQRAEGLNSPWDSRQHPSPRPRRSLCLRSPHSPLSSQDALPFALNPTHTVHTSPSEATHTVYTSPSEITHCAHQPIRGRIGCSASKGPAAFLTSPVAADTRPGFLSAARGLAGLVQRGSAVSSPGC